MVADLPNTDDADDQSFSVPLMLVFQLRRFKSHFFINFDFLLVGSGFVYELMGRVESGREK